MSRPQPLFQLADSAEDRILRRIPLETLLLSLFASTAALILFDPLTGLFVFLGGLVSIINFYWLKKAVSQSLSKDAKKSIRAHLPLYILRILLILGLIFIIILFFSTKIFAFVVGFSMIIPVFLIEAAGALGKLKKWKS